MQSGFNIADIQVSEPHRIPSRKLKQKIVSEVMIVGYNTAERSIELRAPWIKHLQVPFSYLKQKKTVSISSNDASR